MGERLYLIHNRTQYLKIPQSALQSNYIIFEKSYETFITDEDSGRASKLGSWTKGGNVGQYLLHSYICSNLSTEDSEKNLYPDLVPTAKDLKQQKEKEEDIITIGLLTSRSFQAAQQKDCALLGPVDATYAPSQIHLTHFESLPTHLQPQHAAKTLRLKGRSTQ